MTIRRYLESVFRSGEADPPRAAVIVNARDKDPQGFATFEDVVGKRALATSAACVKLLANTLAAVPMVVERQDGDGRFVADAAHPLNALLRSPSATMSGYRFWRTFYRDAFKTGNAYAPVTRAQTTRGRIPVQLTYAAPWRVQYRPPAPGGRYPRFLVNGVRGGEQRMVRYFDMLTLHDPDFDPDTGTAPAVIDSSGWYAATIQRRAAMLIARNMDRGFGGKLYVKAQAGQILTADQIDVLMEAMTKTLTGQGDPRKVAVLQPGLELDSVPATTMRELMLDSILQWTDEQICRAHGVPPRMVGVYKGGTRQSAASSPEADRTEFYDDSIAPPAQDMGEELSRKLLLPDEKDRGYRVRLPVEAIKHGTLSERAKIADMMVSKGGQWTINEGRELTGQPPRDDGDRLLPSKGAPADQGGSGEE